MKNFSYWFEGETGLVTGEVDAVDFRHASNILKLKFPDDHGSDGELTDEFGEEEPIQW